MKDADDRVGDTASLTQRSRADLVAAAARMGITPELALEMALNRFYVKVMRLTEGDLATVDFSRSLPAEALSRQATSASLPRCEGV